MPSCRHSISAAARRFIGGFCLLLPLLALVPGTSASGETGVPELKHYATDLTGTLTPDQVSQLDQLLSSFDRSTSTQIVVLMIPSLDGEEIEDYSLRVAEANKIGKKGKDNGALLLVSKNDRKARIEVGYGLEGAVTDALSGQIIRQEIAPRFRQGDYYGGLRAGVEAIIAASKDEYHAEPAPGGGRRSSPAMFAVIMIAFILVRLMRRRRGFFFWGGGPWIGGGGGWGGGSGGGFSGGGGSFGGGGASGSW